MEHEVEIAIYTTEIGGTTLYQAYCHCGNYRSKWRYFPGHAQSAGLEHIKGKGGNGKLIPGYRRVNKRDYESIIETPCA